MAHYRIEKANASYTRPADTTAYAANDTVANSTSAPVDLDFDFGDGTSATIVGARLLTDQSTNTARFRLHLYSAAPDAINDNAAFTLLYANRLTRVGTITFSAAGTAGSGSTAAQSENWDVRIPVPRLAGGQVFGLLEVLDAFTPASAQKIEIELVAEMA